MGGVKKFLHRAKLVVLAVIAAYVLIVIFANTDPKLVNLIFWQPEPPLVLLLLGMVLVGFVAGLIVAGKLARRKAAKRGAEVAPTAEAEAPMREGEPVEAPADSAGEPADDAADTEAV